MYYFDRADGLKSIPSKTESTNERSELEALCNTYWDMLERKPVEPRQVDVFRRAAHHQAKIVWDWAMIGIVLECRFESPFRELFVELLNDSDLEVRRRMASKVTRLEGDALDTILPALTDNSDAQVRRSAYRLVERLSSDDVMAFVLWRNAIVTWLAYEADPDNRSYLTFAHKRLAAQIGRARKSQDVFDWALIERRLLQATEKTIELIARNHPHICFRGCLIYGDVTNFDVTLQLERHQPETEGDDNPMEWEFQDFPDDLGAGEPFETLWRPIYLELAERRYDAKAPWAQGANPEADFTQMARRVANKLEHSDVLNKLNTASPLKVALMTNSGDV
jgi:hypothetical protein